MFHEYPGFAPPIAQLFELANRPFDAAAFKAACEEFAPFDPRSSDDFLWSFPFEPVGEPRLIVGIGDDPAKVECAILSFCWWETLVEIASVDDETLAAERQKFDRLFAEALAATIDVLGPPLLSGSDDGIGYRHALWRGRTGLLILQQSNYDCQFGDDLNYWLTKWSGPDPCPTKPFIDWLASLDSPERR